MNEYIEIVCEVSDNSIREILIAKLAAGGAEGFEEEKNILKAFVPIVQFDKSTIDDIFNADNLQYSTAIIENKNWNAIWESNFQPVLVDNFCAIRADFHPAIPSVSYDIIITPKMSFGTGHHATTFMMIKAMSALNFAGKSVFDYGTGTGVLAILAEKLGAFSVVAIDNDLWSIENAIENFNINKCDKILLYNNIEFFNDSKYDIILANINRNTILDNLTAIKQHLSVNGVLLISGLLSGDKEIITQAAERNKLKLNNSFEKNGWICLGLINSE